MDGEFSFERYQMIYLTGFNKTMNLDKAGIGITVGLSPPPRRSQADEQFRVYPFGDTLSKQLIDFSVQSTERKFER